MSAPIIEITLAPPPVVEITVTGGPSLTITAQPQVEVEIVQAGVQGAPGPQGAPGQSAASYEHLQALAADVWTVNHNLGLRPAVTVLSPGGLEVEASVTHISVNQTVITFVTPQAGSARFN
jgi:hypothetical protein